MTTSANDRRLLALRRTTARRTRLEDTLRATLASRRAEHERAVQGRDEKLSAVQAERGTLAACHDRIARMMSGNEAFSLTEMTDRMRFAELVAEQLRALESELAALEQAVEARAGEVAAAARAIANNRGRIDMCNERIVGIGRTLEAAANDAADEEAEESALARIRDASGKHA
ncbi:type III secretion protein [Paraburkholderia sediminicola]|uniref:type III secretion protein n=1 Tax=Paraburkholderia sediminicola TaxID=458836 RepID=UPI0038B75A25